MERKNTHFLKWLKSPLGLLLLKQEEKAVSELVEGVFGYYLLQIGGSKQGLSHLEGTHLQSQFSMGTDQIDLKADFSSLPIASDSLDAIYLSHGLDFSEDPKQTLREVERVLISEGHLILTGFNPWSLWGIRRFLPSARKQSPWNGHFISFVRMADWLSLLGFDIEEKKLLAFTPPISNPVFFEKMSVIEKWGAKWLPWFAGVYVIKAVKRVSTITPVKQKWHLKRDRSTQVAETAASSARGQYKKAK